MSRATPDRLADRALLIGLVLALLVALTASTVVRITVAAAASASFSESFTGATLSNPSNWTSSTGPGGVGPTDFGSPEHAGEFVCLTALAEGQSITVRSGSIVGCPQGRDSTSTSDSVGSGALRLTDNRFMQSAMVLYNRPQKMSDGLDITFRFAMHSGINRGGDGFAFFIKDGSNTDDSPGGPGGSLGYGLRSNNSSSKGISGGLLGIGFDFLGAYSHSGQSILPARTCVGGPSITLAASGGQVYDHVVVRGPDLSSEGNGSCGYEYLGRSGTAVDFGRATTGDGNTAAAPNRASAERRARIIIDKPGLGARVKVFVWSPVDPQPSTPVLDIPQPAELQGVTDFKFGFAAATGWSTLVHEIWDLEIVLADPVVQAFQTQMAAQAQSAPTAATPRLTCVPDPVEPGSEVHCTVVSGPSDHEILWMARNGDRTVASQGVLLDRDGTGSFTFAALTDASGARLDVELVGWGVETTVDVTVGGPVPVRVDAGTSPPVPITEAAVLLLVLLMLAPARRRARTDGS